MEKVISMDFSNLSNLAGKPLSELRVIIIPGNVYNQNIIDDIDSQRVIFILIWVLIRSGFR